MSRGEVLDWIDAGRVAPEHQDRALREAGVLPTPAGWRAFLIQLTLWLGTIALATSVIFFFAFNWDDLGRIAKFALVEALIVAALAALWWTGVDRLAGKAVLTLLALLTGALLALAGQIYQTGADTYELFAWWAVLILPWVLVGRFGPLWLLWLGLLNLAVYLFFALGRDGEGLLWILFGLNGLALVAWEAGRRAGIAWLQDSWVPRLVAVAGGIVATGLATYAIVDGDDLQAGPLPAVLAYAAWLGALYYWFRRVRTDAFMLAGGVLSLIIVITVFLSDAMLDNGDAGAFLFIGMAVIGMSAAGALWLKAVVSEQRG